MRRESLLLLVALWGLGSPARSAPKVESVTVHVRLVNLLVSREAPNRLEFSTPWRSVERAPTGPAHPDAAFTGYFASLAPVTFPVVLPERPRPGAYQATLNAVLYVCDKVRKVCTQRSAQVPVALTVQPGGRLAPVKPVVLTDRHFTLPVSTPVFR